VAAVSTSPTATLADCVFITPPGWSVQHQIGHVRLQNTESGCLILVIEPQSSSGDIEQDARAAFELMYRGWAYQKSGEQAYTLSKSRTPQGLEYCAMEAAMSTTAADGRYHLEEGVAVVIKAGAPIVIIGARHNSSVLAHDRCTRYEGWPRFLASFRVKNATPPAHADEDPSSRIIGRWVMTESRASGEYVFAANRQYQFSGAIGTSYTTSERDHDIIYTTTSAFQGDGSYSVSGHRLTINPRAAGSPEEMSLRFVKINRGGSGWKDRLYLRKNDANGEYEVGYEKP
jgi:hypothetical protein